MKKNRIVVLVDMDAFFASCEQQEKPFLRGKPVAVGGKNIVAACSYEAKAYGVKSGMSTYKAIEICPSLIVVPGDMEKYAFTSREIMKMLPDYTSEIEIFSVDEAFLDVTDTVKFWDNNPFNIAKDLRERIKRRFGINASVGISYNKLMAKLASFLAKPDGIKMIKRDDARNLLENLPVEKLSGIGQRLKKELNALGIVTCGELARFPVTILKKLFGQYGLLLHYMAMGEDSSAVKEAVPKNRSMGHSKTIPGGIEDKHTALIYLFRLCEMVGRKVRKSGMIGKTVSITIRYEDFFTFTRQITLSYYIESGEEIYEIAKGLFMQTDTLYRIRLLGVSLSGLVKASRQIRLKEDERGIRLRRAVDAINNRYGEDTVKRASFEIIRVPVRSISNFEKHLDLEL